MYSNFFGTGYQPLPADRIKSSGPHTCRRCTNLDTVLVQPDALNQKSLNGLLMKQIQATTPLVVGLIKWPSRSLALSALQEALNTVRKLTGTALLCRVICRKHCSHFGHRPVPGGRQHFVKQQSDNFTATGGDCHGRFNMKAIGKKQAIETP